MSAYAPPLASPRRLLLDAINACGQGLHEAERTCAEAKRLNQPARFAWATARAADYRRRIAEHETKLARLEAVAA